MKLPLRPKDAIPIVTDDRVVAASFPWKIAERMGVVVVAKCTFGIVHDREASPLAEQPPLTGDLHHDDDDAASLRYASDFAPFKPKADVLLVGHAYPETPRSHTTSVQIAFGSALHRALAVVGDREWHPSGPTPPRAFERMPLRYERAFGGPTYPANPVGAGVVAGYVAGRLPNLELPTRMIKGPDDRPPPACFGPLSRTWAPRTSRMGHYDDAWLAGRWPYFPSDFDWSHFNAAPVEQRIAYPRGDEAFSLAGVVPGAGVVNGALPGLVARAYAHPNEAGGALREVPLHVDTVAFDADAMTVALVFRGFVETSSELAPEIAAFFVALERASRPVDLRDARDRLAARLASLRGTADEASTGPATTAPEAGAPHPAAPAAEASRSKPPPPPLPDAPALERDEVLACVGAGGDLAGIDLSGSDLSDVDLAGRNLRGVRLLGAKLSGTRFDGADLTGAVLTRASGYRTSFRGATLAGANLAGAAIVEADLSNAMLEDASMPDVDAAGARFEGARFSRAILTDAKLDGAKFDGAEASGADLSGATMIGASFRGSTLDDASIYGANAERASFDGASMARFRADGANLAKSSFVRARASGSSFHAACLAGATLGEAELDDTVFAEADLDRAVLARASAKSARFRHARLSHVNAQRANLMEANFEHADLGHADLRGANLYSAQALHASLAGALLEHAIVAGAKLG